MQGIVLFKFPTSTQLRIHVTTIFIFDLNDNSILSTIFSRFCLRTSSHSRLVRLTMRSSISFLAIIGMVTGNIVRHSNLAGTTYIKYHQIIIFGIILWQFQIYKFI